MAKGAHRVRAPLALEHWDAIRRIWEYDPDEPSPEVAAARAGAKFDFDPPSRQACYQRISKEGWQRRGSMAGIVQAAHRKADRLVQADGTPEPPPPPPPAEPAPRVDPALIAWQAKEASEDKRAEILARHRGEWRQVAALRQEAVQLRATNMTNAMDRMRLAKLTAETTKLQQDGERRAWGLDEPEVRDVGRMSDDELKAILAGKVV